MGRITIDQSHQIMAILATNTDWDSIDFDATNLQNTVVRNATGAGTAFTAWLKSGATMEAAESALLLPKKAKTVKTVLKQTSSSFAYAPVTNSFDPNAFYQTRAGLWVSDDFRRLIVANAKPVEKLDVKSGTYFDLTKNARDREIKNELPEGHELEISELCARIAQMILAQPGGKSGDLLNNGYANLFYVAGFVVHVHWDSGRKEWYVGVWKLGAYQWDVGFRAFSSN